MKLTSRAYAEERGDFQRLCDFLIANNEVFRTHSTWCLGRFVDWRYVLSGNKTAVPDFHGRNAQLWFDGLGRVAGFAISEEGGPQLAIVTLPGYRFLFEELLTWGLAAWGERGVLEIEITALQQIEKAVLERHGFRHKADFLQQGFDLHAELAAPRPLPEGFTMVDMALHPDYRAQRRLRDNAFHGRDDVPDEVLQREMLFRNRLHDGPTYHAPTDLCVMAPDGRFVSGCEALIDAHNLEADIERVCTHSDFRRRGLATAVIQECLARLQAMGYLRAYIAGFSDEAIKLYAGLGNGAQITCHIFANG